MARPTSNYRPIGSEWIRKDGMVLVKVENEKWIYKQRKVWIDNYGEIPKNHFIIFLDGNKQNYDINNLACVTSREASLMANYKLFSIDKEVTETGLIVSKLMIEEKTKLGIGAKPKHRKKYV